MTLITVILMVRESGKVHVIKLPQLPCEQPPDALHTKTGQICAHLLVPCLSAVGPGSLPRPKCLLRWRRLFIQPLLPTPGCPRSSVTCCLHCRLRLMWTELGQHRLLQTAVQGSVGALWLLLVGRGRLGAELLGPRRSIRVHDRRSCRLDEQLLFCV